MKLSRNFYFTKNNTKYRFLNFLLKNGERYTGWGDEIVASLNA